MSAHSRQPTEPAWGELWQLFHRVLEATDERQRQRLLDQAETSLRQEVLELVDAHEGRGSRLVTPAPSAEDPLAGQLFGPYRVQRLIGEGGMGTVYQAEQSEPIHRRVALKIIRDSEAPEHAVQRFKAERQVLVMMNHQNVATAYAAGGTEIDGRAVPWLAMEWVSGLPIDTFCDRFALPESARLDVLRQLLSGLAHAHRKGIVHRDIKAANVLVTVRDGEALVKIIDFGIAKSLGARVIEGAPQTRHGAPLGTPGAMSPEQAAGDLAVEATSDVYSAGLLAARLFAAPSPEIARVLERATHHDPTHRYRDAAAFAEALAELDKPKPLSSSPGSARGASRAKSPTFIAALVALVALAAAAWLVIPQWLSEERAAEKNPARVDPAVDAMERNSTDRHAADPALIGPALIEAPGRAEAVPIAVTFDDLPAPRSKSLATVQAMTDELLETLERRGVPTIGFVNSGQVESENERAERVDLLRAWLDGGHQLGNHTAKHLSLHDVPVDEFLADIEEGEPLLHELLGERGQELRYFRHPYLRTGLEIETKERVDGWLESRGYIVAPVTLDNADWMYASLYDRRLRALDQEGADEIARAYLDLTERVFTFWEKVSLRVNGEPHPHVLLLHINQLNADHFDAIADIIDRRGYRYVTLDEALEHPIYQSPDRYAGPAGMIWQYRWAVTAGLEIDWGLEPEPHDWIAKAFGNG